MDRRKFVASLGGGLGGATAVAPFAARAQQAPMPVIGFLHPAARTAYAPFLTGFHQGLGELGFVDGRNVAIEYRFGEGSLDRLPEFAAELVARRVAVIASGSVQAAVAAKNASSTIPIVFGTAIDPIASGLVASLNRPGGNATGLFLFSDELLTKRLEMLAGEDQLGDVFAKMAHENVRALLVNNDTFFTNYRERVVALATRHAIAASYEFREFALAGGLFSYGSRQADIFRQIGIYTGRILKGEKPADLPVVQPTRFEFVLNLKTAKALGLDIPLKLHAFADEVIE